MATLIESRPRDGQPRVIRRGICDGDGIVYELLPMTAFTFGGRDSTFESIPLPVFDTAEYGAAVLSLMIRNSVIVGGGSRARLWIQNAFQTSDDPSVIFASDDVALTIDSTDTPSMLKTGSWSPVGPGARLRIEWQQGTGGLPVSSQLSFAVWLTLRRTTP